MNRKNVHLCLLIAATCAVSTLFVFSAPSYAQAAVWVQVNSAGKSLYENSDLDGAEQKWLEALKLARQIAPHDPRVAETMSELAELYSRTQRLEQAAAMWKGAIRIKQLVYGDNSPELEKDLDNFAKTSRLIGEDDLAQYADYRAEKIRLINYPVATSENSSPMGVGQTKTDAAMIQEALCQNRLAKAQALAIGALNNNSNTSSDGAEPSPLTLVPQILRAQLQAGDVTQAKALANETLNVVQNRHGYQHCEVAYALKLRAATMRAVGEGAIADDDERRVAKIYADIASRSDYSTGHSYDLLPQRVSLSRRTQIASSILPFSVMPDLISAERDMIDWRNQITIATLAERDSIRMADSSEMRALESRQREAEAHSRWMRHHW